MTKRWLRWAAMFFAALTLSSSKGFAAPGFVGFEVRPTVCLSNCDGALVTFGPEFGYRFIGMALRFGFRDDVTYFFPDLRFYFEGRVARRVYVTPFFEFTPMLGFGDGSTLVQLILRPGFRVSFAAARNFWIYFEPMALDIAVYTSETVAGFYTAHTTTPVVSYTLGFGVQGRI
jgi:hypothetical protein